MSQFDLNDEQRPQREHWAAPAPRAAVAKRLACLLAASLVAACSPEMAMTEDSLAATAEARIEPAWQEPRVEPIPPIPAALRGCWFTEAPADPEEPGVAHRMLVTATTIEMIWESGPRRVATAEYVTRVTPTLIEGLFSAPDGEDRDTIATSLMLGDGVDLPVDSLRRAEGDAGSDYYHRCPS